MVKGGYGLNRGVSRAARGGVRVERASRRRRAAKKPEVLVPNEKVLPPRIRTPPDRDHRPSLGALSHPFKKRMLSRPEALIDLWGSRAIYY